MRHPLRAALPVGVALMALACQTVTGGSDDLSPPCTVVAECDDGDPCTVETCEEGRCQYTEVAGPEDDVDGDGVSCAAGDCDDVDPEVYPGAAEVCDGKDNDCDPETPDGLGAQCACPGWTDMVLLPSLPGVVCIDRYEASRGPGGAAESVAGALPWVEVTFEQAAEACEAAGKRLCGEDEWSAGCGGSTHPEYPYGDIYDSSRCNGEGNGEGIEAAPSGSMPLCEGGYAGLFDMSGNVWEWTDACDEEPDGSCQYRGGSFLLGQDNLRCASSQSSPRGTTDTTVGFRCCHGEGG